MNKELPPKWRKNVTLESNLSSVNGLSSQFNLSSSLPPEVSTVKDLFIERVCLPDKINDYETDKDSLSDLFRIEPDISELPKSIESIVDYRLSLFTLATNGTPADKECNESNIRETFGRHIGGAYSAHKITGISRNADFKYLGLPSPNTKPKNIIYLNIKSDIDLYVLTDAMDISEPELLIKGLPEDCEYTLVSSKLVDRFMNLFNLKNINSVATNVQFDNQALMSISDDNKETFGLIAPRNASYDLKESWNNENFHRFSIITDTT